MADKKLTWVIEVDSKTGQAAIKNLAAVQDKSTKAMKRQESAAKSLKSGFSNLYKVLGAGAAIYGAMKLYQTVGEWEKLTGIQEVAEAQLKQVMISSGRYSDQAFQNMKTLASSLQEVTTFGDEATMQGMKFLFTYKQISDDMMPRTVKAMQDFAALSGGDLATAANVMGKAAMGMTGALARYGITVDKATYKNEGFAGVLREIESQIKGQAEALRQTRSGELTAFGNAVGDVKEKLGDFSLSVKSLVAKDVLDDIARLDSGLAGIQGSGYDAWVKKTADNVIVLKNALLAAGASAVWLLEKLNYATESYAEMLYGSNDSEKRAMVDLTKANEELLKIKKELSIAQGMINNDVEITNLQKLVVAKEKEIEVRRAVLQTLHDEAAAERERASQGPAAPPVLPQAAEPEATTPSPGAEPAFDGDMGLDSVGGPMSDIYDREVWLAEKSQQLARETSDIIRRMNMGDFEFKRDQIEREAALEAERIDSDKEALEELASWKQARLLELDQAEAEARTALMYQLRDETIAINESIFEVQREQLEREVEALAEKYATDKEMLDELAEYKKAKLGEIAEAETDSDKTAKDQKKKTGQSEVSDFASNMKAIGKHSKAAFAAYKAVSTAQAIIKTYESATGAYAALAPIPVVGPALAVAAAAAAVVAGMANVAAIQQQQPPAYGDGGISWRPEMALVGEKGPEAHVPLKGGNIPVQISGRGGFGGGGSVRNTNVTVVVTGNTFRSQEAEDANTRALAAQVVDQLAVTRVLDDFRNDGDIRRMVGGGL